MVRRVVIYKGTGVQMARMAGDSTHFGRHAHDLRAGVQREAARNIDTARFYDSIEVAKVRGRSGSGRSVNDRLVYSTDPGAYWIEHGRTHRSESGDALSRVPGQYPFRRAIRKMS